MEGSLEIDNVLNYHVLYTFFTCLLLRKCGSLSEYICYMFQLRIVIVLLQYISISITYCIYWYVVVAADTHISIGIDASVFHLIFSFQPQGTYIH